MPVHFTLLDDFDDDVWNVDRPKGFVPLITSKINFPDLRTKHILISRKGGVKKNGFRKLILKLIPTTTTTSLINLNTFATFSSTPLR